MIKSYQDSTTTPAQGGLWLRKIEVRIMVIRYYTVKEEAVSHCVKMAFFIVIVSVIVKKKYFFGTSLDLPPH